MDQTSPKAVCHCLQRLFSHPTSKKHCLPKIVRRRWEASSAFFMHRPSSSAASSGTRIFLFLLFGFAISSAHADVIVLANRTQTPVGFRFVPKSGEAQQLNLPVGETMPLYLDGKADVVFAANAGQKRYTLDANCAYYFGRDKEGHVDLQKIGLGEDGTAAEGRKLPDKASRAPTITIPVKILVDEEEPGRPGVWEQRLRRRVEAASAVFEKNYHIAFRVAAVGTWKSDNAITDFFDSLADFEKKVDPAPAKIAIGFTSQWKMARGRIHMAGTRGPLHAHILVREGSPEINEAERLEFLIHELGHHLGAAHSPEWQSVMRPVLGDKRAGRSDFKIQFDPVNALTIAMVTEEIRRSNISKVSQLQYVTRKRLEQIYRELARTMPEDPAGYQYAGLMRTDETPLALTTRQMLQQIIRAAVENRALPVTVAEGSKQHARREADALTAYYVREAARAAMTLPDEVAVQSFLLGLAIGLDGSAAPPSIPGAAGLLRAVESPSERQIRLAILGKPTVRGRLDFTQHFFSSACMTAINGADASQTALLDTELSKAERPVGLSFKVVAADRAGSRLGQSLVDKRFSLRLLATAFEVASYMPEVDSLPDGISAKDLNSQYGAKTDPRFLKRLREIDQSVLLLPGYRTTGSVFGR